jgi:hypothetical protein
MCFDKETRWNLWRLRWVRRARRVEWMSSGCLLRRCSPRTSLNSPAGRLGFNRYDCFSTRMFMSHVHKLCAHRFIRSTHSQIAVLREILPR